MIKNIAKKIHIYCGCHGEKDRIMLEPHEPSSPGMSMFYACPKYYPENREEYEQACANRLSVSDYEKMIVKISDILEEALGKRAVINLRGMQWSNGNGVYFKIVGHDSKSGDIDVFVINKRALG